MARIHKESHRGHRIGWLRAAVLGSNDGTFWLCFVLVLFVA
jgi:hypothetical protein